MSAGILLKGSGLTFDTFGGPRELCTKAAAFTGMCFVMAAGRRATNEFANEAWGACFHIRIPRIIVPRVLC